MDQDDELLTVQEAAALCKVAVQTLNRWRLKRGDGPPFVKLGGAVRYPKKLLMAWLSKRLHWSTEEPFGPEDSPVASSV